MKFIQDNLILWLMMKKDWMLDYLCGGKGLIPYEKIKSHKDLDAAAEGDFFS